jgi:phosphoserine aminotransferase
MTKGGKLIDGIFIGETINTPSMLCVEDYLDTLQWAKAIGGLKALRARADANFKTLADYAAKTSWIDFFAEDPATRSNTSICLKIVDPDVLKLDLAGQEAFLKAISARLDKEGVAYDINFHRDAPPHFRIWGGATIEASDLAILAEWLDWAYAQEKAALKAAA